MCYFVIFPVREDSPAAAANNKALYRRVNGQAVISIEAPVFRQTASGPDLESAFVSSSVTL